MGAEISGLLLYAGTALIAYAAVFLPLAYFFPSKPGQALLRRDMATDALYWFGGSLFYWFASKYLMLFCLSAFFSAEKADALVTTGALPLADLPFAVQFLIMAVGVDFIQYWLHRLFHKPRLWKWHAIHHSSPNVDWMSSTRWHPVNVLIYVTLILTLVRLLGFSPRVFGWFVISYSINGALVHANLNWTYGPLRIVFASPVFHRWHHTSPAEGGEKNFAPNFSIFDVIFGTFYMPEGVQPVTFGVFKDAPPEGFIGQFLYPFVKRRKLAEVGTEIALRGTVGGNGV